MDTPEQSNDPQLLNFEQWLKDSRINPPVNLLVDVRARLRDSSTRLDETIDQLFEQDPSLSDPQMIWKVRGKLHDSRPVGRWFKWLAPIAAAATITLTVISFQSNGPKALQNQDLSSTLAIMDKPVDLDEEMTRILALASNLDSQSELSKLESVEKLSFLFE